MKTGRPVLASNSRFDPERGCVVPTSRSTPHYAKRFCVPTRCGWCFAHSRDPQNENGCVLAASMALVFALVQGCVVIPTPPHNYTEWLDTQSNSPRFATRKNITTKNIHSIIPGQTKREEVMRQFGQPDLVSDDGRKTVYHWTKVNAYLIFVVAYLPPMTPLPKNNYLIITFDERDTVESLELKSILSRRYWMEGLLTTRPKDGVDLRQYRAVKLIVIDSVNSDYSRECVPKFEGLLREKLQSLGRNLVESQQQMTIEVTIKSIEPGDRGPRWWATLKGGWPAMTFKASFRDDSGCLLAELYGGKDYNRMLLENRPAFKGDETIRMDLTSLAVTQVGQFITNNGKAGSKP